MTLILFWAVVFGVVAAALVTAWRVFWHFRKTNRRRLGVLLSILVLLTGFLLLFLLFAMFIAILDRALVPGI